MFLALASVSYRVWVVCLGMAVDEQNVIVLLQCERFAGAGRRL